MAGQIYRPVYKSYRLNERMYGALEGKSKVCSWNQQAAAVYCTLPCPSISLFILYFCFLSLFLYHYLFLSLLSPLSLALSLFVPVYQPFLLFLILRCRLVWIWARKKWPHSVQVREGDQICENKYREQMKQEENMEKGIRWSDIWIWVGRGKEERADQNGAE